MPEENNNSAPTWANFKPPVMTTPYGNTGSVNVDGTKASPTDQTTPQLPSEQVTPEQIQPPVNSAPVVAPTPVAPLIDSSTVSPLPAIPDSSTSNPTLPIEDGPLPSTTVVEPVLADSVTIPTNSSVEEVSSLQDSVNATSSVDPDPTTTTLPETAPIPDLNPTLSPDPAQTPPLLEPVPQVPPVSPPVTSPSTEAPSWTIPSPPLDPAPMAPVESLSTNWTPQPVTPIQEVPVVPESVLPNNPAPISNQTPKHGSRAPLVVGVVAVVVMLAAAGGYVYYTKIAATPASTLGAQVAGDNQSVMNASLGPETWENNYSTSLLAIERGGLELVVTDPAPIVSTPAAKPSSRNDITSLKVKIAKAEVHLATQSVVAQSTDPTATRSASRTIDRWETLRLNDAQVVDLMDLRSRGGALSSMGVTYLAAGHYTEMRLYITQASATFSDGTKKTFDLTTDNGVVKIPKAFNVSSNGTAKVVVDFDAPQSVVGSDQTSIFNPILARFLYNDQSL